MSFHSSAEIPETEHGGTWEPGRNGVGCVGSRHAAASEAGGPGKLGLMRDLLQKQG